MNEEKTFLILKNFNLNPEQVNDAQCPLVNEIFLSDENRCQSIRSDESKLYLLQSDSQTKSWKLPVCSKIQKRN